MRTLTLLSTSEADTAYLLKCGARQFDGAQPLGEPRRVSTHTVAELRETGTLGDYVGHWDGNTQMVKYEIDYPDDAA